MQHGDVAVGGGGTNRPSKDFLSQLLWIEHVALVSARSGAVGGPGGVSALPAAAPHRLRPRQGARRDRSRRRRRRPHLPPVRRRRHGRQVPAR